jgi:hypothetical protein
MAKERVQVQGLGDVAPGITPTIQRAGQYSVAQLRAAPVQAPRSKLLDLAEALGTSMEIVGQYGKLKEFEFKKGQERGEMEAATADLETSIDELDTTGEKLVEQGLLPRSQLLGYQRSFRRRIGQRYARKTYANSLQARMEEVTQNLDSDADIIENILAEERQKITEQLGGSQFAMQGFGDYADSIENSFYNNAVKQRDKATQEYNESLVIEDANDTFPKQILEASVEDDYTDFENSLKTWMEERSTKDRIPRSRMVELIWNGMAKTAVSDLLFQKQPDKAEKILNAITSVDLTGEGGKLGNINRPNALIRTETLSFKSQIQQVKEAIKADVEFDANDIMAVVNPALQSVNDGITGIEQLDAISLRSIEGFLKDVGFEGDIAKEAESLLRSKDTSKLLDYTRLYYANDAKREAYGLAANKIDYSAIQITQRSASHLSKDQKVEVSENMRKAVAEGRRAKDVLDAGGGIGNAPITDVSMKVEAARLEAEQEENTWFERDESYKDYRSSLDAGFEDTLLEFYPKLKVGDVRREIDSDTPVFKDLYNKKIKEAQIKLKNAPDRLEAIKSRFEEIKTEVMGNWSDFVKAKKFYEEGTIVGIEQAKAKGEEFLDTLDIDEETSQEKLESIIKPAAKAWYESIPGFEETTEEDREMERQSKIIRNVDLNELGPNKIKDRRIAWNKADVVKSAYNKNPDNVDLINIYELMRRKWGYQNPSEYLSDRSEFELDFRETPFYTDKASLKEEVVGLFQEWSVYSQTPKAERDLEAFPIFKKWNEVFGVRDDKDILLVKDAQLNILKAQQ